MNSVAGRVAAELASALPTAVVQPDARDGRSLRAGGAAEAIWCSGERRVEHAARLHLVPVVILGVDPEDRRRPARDARPRCARPAGWRSAP